MSWVRAISIDGVLIVTRRGHYIVLKSLRNGETRMRWQRRDFAMLRVWDAKRI